MLGTGNMWFLLFLMVVIDNLSTAFHSLPVVRTHTRQLISMASSSSSTEVVVETPSFNSRKITASIVVNSPLEDVWNILTDYNRLAERVPNLVKSYIVPTDPYTLNNNNNGLGLGSSSMKSKNNVRIFQEGAQKIIGFDFRASLTMDMKEEDYGDARTTAGGDVQERRLYFKLVDGQSRMFSAFDGNWHIRAQSHSKEFDPLTNDYQHRHKTVLTYTVLVKPKGPVNIHTHSHTSYPHTHIHTHSHSHNLSTRTHTHTPTSYPHTFAHIHIHTHTHTHSHNLSTHTHPHTHILSTHIRTHTHTHTHTPTTYPHPTHIDFL